MRLSHITVTMPPGNGAIACAFYSGLLGMTEVPPPEVIRRQGAVWFNAGAVDVHVFPEEPRASIDVRRHFALECADLDALRARLDAAGHKTTNGGPAPWRRFFVHDPFGNRIEIHEVGGGKG